jgi:hypothetical protein
MLAAADMMQEAARVGLGSPAALSATNLAAGLASALTSLAKKAVQFTKAAVMQRQPAAAANAINSIAAACFPAALIKVMFRLYPRLAAFMKTAAVHCAPIDGASSNQAAASIALLAAVLARSLVQLADAMEAAGPQLLFRSLIAKPLYALMWQEGEPGDTRHLLACPFGFP